MKPKHYFSLLLISSFFLIACGKKLPPEFKALEGTWQNPEVYMQISEDGSFSYKRESQGQKVTINTWITEYSKRGFRVSTVFGSTVFVLNRKPYFDDSTKTTRMVVDGRMLVKQNAW